MGTNVLISNPRLCGTGLDLLDFPTLIFFEVDYSLYTMSQAARRGWRLIQTQECTTYYPYYKGLMEHQAVELVGRKIAAANLLYGETSSLGLSALSNGGGKSLFAQLAATIDKDAGLTDLHALFAQANNKSTVVMESSWTVNLANKSNGHHIDDVPVRPVIQLDMLAEPVAAGKQLSMF